MIQTWQFQDAESKFSKVIKGAVNSGPQLITQDGAAVAVVLSYTEYQRIVTPKQSLSDFFQNSSLVGIEFPRLK